MIACSCGGPRLHAQSPRAVSRNGCAADRQDDARSGARHAAQTGMELAPAAAVGGEAESGDGLDLALGGDPGRAPGGDTTIAALDCRPRSARQQNPPGREGRSSGNRHQKSRYYYSHRPALTSNRAAQHLRGLYPKWCINRPILLFTCYYVTEVVLGPQFDSPTGEATCSERSNPICRDRSSTFALRVAFADILTRIAAELALFAGAGFLLFAINDVLVDCIYFVRRGVARDCGLQPLPAVLRQLFRVQEGSGLHRHPRSGMGRGRRHRRDAEGHASPPRL